MALGVTLVRGSESVTGNKKRNVLDLTFDNSYPDNGESLTARQMGLHRVDDVLVQPQQGFWFNYDRTNSLLRAFKLGPVLLTEPSGTIVAGATYTLRNLPGYILAVRVTAGGVTGAFRVIPTGETPATTEVAMNWTTGVMTFLGTDAVTALTVLYIPRGVPGFTTALLVIDEIVDVTTDSGNLAARAAAICCVWDDSNNNPLTIVPVGEAPGAGACAIDINNGGNTTITVNAAGTTDSLKVTYLRFAANPLTVGLGFRDQTDWIVASNTVGPGTDQAWDVNGLVLPGFGQVIVGETAAAANLQALLVDPAGVVAANVAVYDPSRNTLSLNGADAYNSVEIPLLYLSHEMAGGIMQEVENGADLSALVNIRGEALGY